MSRDSEMPVATRWPSVWRSFLVSLWVTVGVIVAPLPASAHPSDFRTLTIDLIFGQTGLEVIDAAVVESSGPSYEPFPSVELRQAVAEEVLAALDLSMRRHRSTQQ